MADGPRKPFGHGKASGSAPKAPPRAVPKPPPPPAFEVVEDEPDDGFEVVEEAPPVKKAPRKAQRAEPEPEPEPVKPKPKKKKRKLDELSKRLLAEEEADEARRAASLKHFEWTIPGVLLGIGLLMSIVGAFGASKGVTGIYTMGVLTAFVSIFVPLSIGALMVLGVIVGINYGRLWPAVLKMAAITFIVNGIWLIGEWMKLPPFAIAPISCFISYGLFMSQFDLDTQETGTSMGVLNVMTFVGNIILIGFLVVAEASSGGGKLDDDYDEDPPPAKKRDRDTPRLNPDDPEVMPDDDDE